MRSASSIQALTAKSTRQAFRYLQGIALFVACSLPSVWLLTQPFPWKTGLAAVALGTVAPLLIFGLIGGLRLVWGDDTSAVARVRSDYAVFRLFTGLYLQYGSASGKSIQSAGWPVAECRSISVSLARKPMG